MRRPLASAALAVALAATMMLPASAQPSAPQPDPTPQSTAKSPDETSDEASEEAQETLETVKEIVEGTAPGKAKHLTQEITDLTASMDELPEEEREEATELLATETGGAAGPMSPQANPDKAVCNQRICVHHSNSGVGRPRARQVLEVMQEVWQNHTGTYGYRTPVKDRGVQIRRTITGGKHAYPSTEQFDVVLEDLSTNQGLYGYCQPHAATEKQRRRHRTPGFCVLDDDYAKQQFPRNTPDQNLRVTAAHEFFHVVQYAYDYAEDAWLKEATATWMEERFADGVNDNRQFLRFGQVRRPARPLDGSHHAGTMYGNWAFFEFLSQKFGPRIVRQVWHQARGPHPNRYSVNAIARVLRNRGGLDRNYAHFAGVNTAPASFYDEGARWGRGARIYRNRWVARAKREAQARVPVRNLTSRSVDFRFNYTRMRGPRWKLILGVIGQRNKPTGAHVTIHLRNGRVISRDVRLNARGNRKLGVRLRRGQVAKVTVTVSTATRRYRCDRGTSRACEGAPRPPRAKFIVRARVRR